MIGIVKYRRLRWAWLCEEEGKGFIGNFGEHTSRKTTVQTIKKEAGV
jgi:hypothetical protein